MISITTGQTKKMESSDGLFSSNAFKNFSGHASGRAAKTHDYTCYECGVDYFFEINSLKAVAYMTGQGKGIKPNDYIILQLGSHPQRYQVKSIDYYGHPSEMWIALLKAIA